ncbi:MAG: hypothetical protein ACXAD7_25995 [Candidatus Kariarchaeaceae archaeon]
MQSGNYKVNGMIALNKMEDHLIFNNTYLLNNHSIVPLDILKRSNNDNFLVVSICSYYSKFDPEEKNYYISILEIDGNGNHVMERNYPDPNEYSSLPLHMVPSIRPQSFIETSDEGLIVTGWYSNRNGQSWYGAGILLYFDQYGSYKWDRTIVQTIDDKNLFSTSIHDVVQDNAGNIIILGSSADQSLHYPIMWIQKWDSEGNLLFNRIIENSFSNNMSWLNNARNLYVSAENDIIFTYGMDVDYSGYREYFIEKRDQFGDVIWNSTVGKKQKPKGISSIEYSENGNGSILLSGYINPDRTTDVIGTTNCMIVMFDGNGRKLWEELFLFQNSRCLLDHAIESRNNLNNTNRILSMSSIDQSIDFWLTSFDSEGNYVQDNTGRIFKDSNYYPLRISQTSNYDYLLLGMITYQGLNGLSIIKFPNDLPDNEFYFTTAGLSENIINSTFFKLVLFLVLIIALFLLLLRFGKSN